jgi:hypothetical protein
MNKCISKPICFAIFMLVVLTSCKKDLDKPGSGNTPPEQNTARNFQFVLDSLPGEGAVLQNLSAIVSVLNAQGEPVLTDKVLAITNYGKYFSETLTLPRGNYRLSKFVVSQNNSVKYATPYSGSAKAHLVNLPLQVSFSLENDAMKPVSVQVAKVNHLNEAVQFGYPAGSFGSPANPGNTHIKIRVQPLIRIGEVVYDSIPVTLTVVTWDQTNQQSVQNHILSPGKNELLLPAIASKYQFKISKWGTYDEVTLQRDQIQEGAVYSLGGSRAAKKLSEELTYKLVNGSYLPETKTSFQYDGSGKIMEILHYRKKPDHSNYIAMVDKFDYAAGRVQSIKRYDDLNKLMETNTFTYRPDGKLLQVVKNEGDDQTIADINYTALDGGTGISGDHSINVHYKYTQFSYTEFNNLLVKGGNVIQSTRSTTHGNSDEGLYNYDFNINPFIHLQIPNMDFTSYSKNNMISRVNTYENAFPLTEPYEFNYDYDADGYPVELVTKFKTYLTGQHAFTIKTVYKY